MFAVVVLACHWALLVLLCIYGWHRLSLTARYVRGRHRLDRPAPPLSAMPPLTVQLPVYNERFVVERLIDAAASLDYPRDRFEIQVIDDSTDATTALVAARVRYHRQRGLRIVHLRRGSRSGFKAGALAFGLSQARGTLVAIFDADFVPAPDVLRAAVPYFVDPTVGMVQLRWEHLNRGASRLTRAQAVMLDAHFIIEHGGRAVSDTFFNFNGTAGIWRAETIRDAGGWHGDTLTEDLDLSYRAQVRGWRFLFLPGVACSGELPMEMGAFKTQQHRWAKGATQVMRKQLPAIWRAPVGVRRKVEATFHLSANFAYLAMMIDSVGFLVPSVVVRQHMGWRRLLWIDLPFVLFGVLSHVVYFLTSQRALGARWSAAIGELPGVLAVGVGLGATNARAVVEALVRWPSDFVRTPKAGLDRPRRRGYRVAREPWDVLEVGLGLFYGASLLWAIEQQLWASVPLFFLFQNGFLYTGLSTLTEGRTLRGR